jgi:hypothetical protein
MLNPDDVHELFCPIPDDIHYDPPPTKAFSVRVPEPVLAYIDEMARIAGISRNSMTIRLLDWGTRFALENLPKDLGERVLKAHDGPPGYCCPYSID